MSRSLLLLAAVVLAACSSGSSGLTYYKDVKPIFDARCAGCHHDGGIAPFSLTSAEQAVTYKAAIQGAVTSKRMPPWLADDSCASYSSDRSLSAEQIATINQWVDTGAAVGDPAAAPAAPAPASGLGHVDFSVKMAAAYTPTTSPDEYRCFILDWPADTEKFVTGYAVHPGNGRIVHHVIAYIAKPADLATYQQLDEADPGPGYKCFGGPGGQLPSWLAAWVPGSSAREFPTGTGIQVQPGSRLVLQIHYNTSTAAPAPDQTSIDFETADGVDHQAFMLPYTNPDWPRQHTMNIPAGEADAVQSYAKDFTPALGLLTGGVFSPGKPVTIYSVGLHMHTRGASASLGIERQGGGEECVLREPKWDFHWQGTYTLATPKLFQPGDQLKIECHYDNSAANQPVVDGRREEPRDLNWGEGTDDEMCLATVYVTQ